MPASSEKLRTIRLYGTLGAKFGRVHYLAVSSTAEAVRAMCAILPGFEKFLMSAKDRGLTFSVFRGRENVAEDQLAHPTGPDEIRFAPVIIGSKRGGLLQTIIGSALIAASFFVPGGGAFGIAALSQGAVFGLGASMVLGGVVQMLSPQTTTSSSTSDSQASYYFSGAVNSTAQGDPVPLAYGRMRVGSKTISSGIYAEDQQ